MEAHISTNSGDTTTNTTTTITTTTATKIGTKTNHFLLEDIAKVNMDTDDKLSIDFGEQDIPMPALDYDVIGNEFHSSVEKKTQNKKKSKKKNENQFTLIRFVRDLLDGETSSNEKLTVITPSAGARSRKRHENINSLIPDMIMPLVDNKNTLLQLHFDMDSLKHDKYGRERCKKNQNILDHLICNFLQKDGGYKKVFANMNEILKYTNHIIVIAHRTIQNRLRKLESNISAKHYSFVRSQHLNEVKIKRYMDLSQTQAKFLAQKDQVLQQQQQQYQVKKKTKLSGENEKYRKQHVAKKKKNK